MIVLSERVKSYGLLKTEREGKKPNLAINRSPFRHFIKEFSVLRAACRNTNATSGTRVAWSLHVSANEIYWSKTKCVCVCVCRARNIFVSNRLSICQRTKMILKMLSRSKARSLIIRVGAMSVIDACLMDDSLAIKPK